MIPNKTAQHMQGRAGTWAAQVSTEISPADTMFEGNFEHYFSVGQSALHCIDLANEAAGRKTLRRVLDFGCGFGRVLRVLRAAFPDAELAACDVSPAALEFCARTFQAEPIRSFEAIDKIRISTRFDLIWCGTVLTNVDAPQFRELLALFQTLLTDDGLLVFTTHGPFVRRRLQGSDYGLAATQIRSVTKGYDATGFGYGDYSPEVRARLGLSRYGISVSAPSWICRQLERLPLRLVAYTEQGWDHHQDSVGCVNRAG